jgi:hypothetical protein
MMRCGMWCSNSRDCEEWFPVGCEAMYLDISLPTCRRIVSNLLLHWKSSRPRRNVQQVVECAYKLITKDVVRRDSVLTCGTLYYPSFLLQWCSISTRKIVGILIGWRRFEPGFAKHESGSINYMMYPSLRPLSTLASMHITRTEIRETYSDRSKRHAYFLNTFFTVLCIFQWLSYCSGSALAQAVIHRLPTAAARVPARVRSSGICSVQSSTGVGFLPVLRFLLSGIPPIAPHSSSSIIIQVGYNMPVLASVTADSFPLHPPPKKKQYCRC